MASPENETIALVFAKKRVTILVTDSGLGGMAIFAEIAARLQRDPIFHEVSLVYYNAWPEQNRGYNRLKDTVERIRVFDQTLEGMRQFQPDLILIACNTLSVLYDRTEFSRTAGIPVIDIVRFGVEMVYEALSASKGTQAVILGTLTTIASRIHHDRLVERGIRPERIISQPCDQLATEIEKGPGSATVVAMIEAFMQQASEQIVPRRTGVFAALCCTHFVYSGHLIRKKLSDRIRGEVTILDPNKEMVAFLFAAGDGTRYPETILDIRVVSKIIWEERKIASISGLIEEISTDTVEALKNYERIPNLFTF